MRNLALALLLAVPSSSLASPLDLNCFWISPGDTNELHVLVNDIPGSTTSAGQFFGYNISIIKTVGTYGIAINVEKGGRTFAAAGSVEYSGSYVSALVSGSKTTDFEFSALGSVTVLCKAFVADLFLDITGALRIVRSAWGIL